MDLQKINSIAQKDKILNYYRTALVNQAKENIKLKREIKELKERLKQFQQAPSYAH